jgi:hypothetical protein
MTSHKSSQPKQRRRKYGKESETYLGKHNYTTSKEITTESGIANELVAQFLKTSSNADERSITNIKITINMKNYDPHNEPLTEEELDNALFKCKKKLTQKNG